MMKCAACPFIIDITGVSPGSVVECPACGGKVRVPTGSTVRVTAQAPAAVPAPPPATTRRSPTTRRGPGEGPAIPRSTRLRNIPPKKGYGVMIGGIVVVAIAAIVGLVVISKMQDSADDDDEAPKTKKPRVVKGPLKPKDPETPVAPVNQPPVQVLKEPVVPSREPESPKPVEKPKEPEKPPETVPKTPEKIQIVVDGKSVETYVEWVPGAKGLMKKDHYPPEGVEPQALEQATELLEAGRVDDLLKKAYLYYMPVLQLSLEDNEKIARNAYEFLNKFCVLYKALNPETGNTYQVDMRLVTSPDNRGRLYLLFLGYASAFTEQFARHEKYGDPWAEPKKFEVSQFDWPKMMRDLKHFSRSKDPQREGPFGYDPEQGQGYNAYRKLEEMGPFKADAYPYLIAYITSPDPMHRQAAIVALNKLTGASLWKFPANDTEAQKAQKEWMAALNIKELPRVPY